MTETRKSFHEDLDDVHADVARLAAMVADLIPRGTAALLAGDLQVAQEIVEYDDELDHLSVQIEEQCYQMLALQQPTAGDLRALITAIRLSSEIERSGDLVVNIAKATRRIHSTSFSPTVRGLIERMSEEAVRLYRAAIEAYLDSDVGLAAAIDDMDDALDDLQRDFVEAVFQDHEERGLVLGTAVQLALIARFYERIGDHAVNIGERVQYLVTGWLPEHEGQARVEARRNAGARSGPDGGPSGSGTDGGP
jgi:phosphate transport system protein